MPEIKHIPQPEYVNLEAEPMDSPLQQIANTKALQLVLDTFTSYEMQRTSNQDPRFLVQDQLYTGWMPVKFWPNTTIPRSSIPFSITFDQIESAHPAICQALFSSGDWFSVEAGKGSQPQSVQGIKDHLQFIVEHAKDDFGGSGVNELKLATKDVLYRGNGGIFLEWNSIQKRPIISWVDLRDLYIDPGLTVPNIDEARSIIRRKMFTVRELQEYRNIPGMNIPSDDELYTLGTQAPYAVKDQTVAQSEAIRGVNYFPNSTDILSNPADKRIECLIYYSKDRIIWVLNRKWIAYNERNPYGFIPFCFAPCYIYPGRWYAMSIPDVQEYNQRYIEALLNARLDRIHLSLEPPRTMKRSAQNLPGNNKWHPGKIVSVDDKDDYLLLQPQDVIPNIFTEIEFLQIAAERRTGINGLGMGVPRGGNVNRTATGVNAQVSGGSMRLLDIIENIENYMLVPMLYKMYHMIRLHTGQYDFLQARTQEGQIYQVPAALFSSKVNFTINASSKMMTKEKLMQIFPFVTQYLLNGPFLQQLSASGQTVDSNELLRFLQDAAGTSQMYTLIRPLTPEEQQQRQQPDPSTQAQMQTKQADNQVRMQIAQIQAQTDLQKAIIAKQEDPAILQIEREKAQQEMQQDAIQNQMRLQFEAQLAKIKMDAEREKRTQEIQLKRMDHQFNIQKTAEQAQMNAVSTRQKMMNDQLAAQNNLMFTKEKNAQALDFEKQKNLMKPRVNERQEPKAPKKKNQEKVEK